MLIIGMALVTIAVRYPVLALVGKLPLPESMFRALRYVPPAVLAAIILPEMFYRDGQFQIALTNAPLLAGIITFAIAWFSKNILLTIVGGMIALLVLKAALGQ
ncbi:MAG: AzlD domain-containing protein [Chloroflexota bacterium]|nr:AzlD domain-containing protein [Chloroflexota bacterium]